MKNLIIILIFLIGESINLGGQCVEVESIKVKTSPACSYLKNGVLTIEHLTSKTPYDVVLNSTVKSYTSDENGVLNVYSLSPGTYTNVKIHDRVNTCPDILIKEHIVIDEYSLGFEGPDKVCEGQEINLKTSVPVSWSINSSLISINKNELNYSLSNSESIEVEVKGIVDGCFERETFIIEVDEKPSVSMIQPDKQYCYNKQNEILALEVKNGSLEEVRYNGNSIHANTENVLLINTGQSTDENIVYATAKNETGCQSDTNIKLQFKGEAPFDEVEILWWPGNIFSAKSETNNLTYKWGWLDENQDVTYVHANNISSGGNFYFAGRNDVRINDLIEKGEESLNILFVEYSYVSETCSNRLLFNSTENYEFRNQTTEKTSDNNVLAYPNPFFESITISATDFPNFQDLKLSIIGSDAKIYNQVDIDSSNAYIVNLSTSEYPSGIYFIHLSSGDYTLASKIIVKQ